MNKNILKTKAFYDLILTGDQKNRIYKVSKNFKLTANERGLIRRYIEHNVLDDWSLLLSQYRNLTNIEKTKMFDKQILKLIYGNDVGKRLYDKRCSNMCESLLVAYSTGRKMQTNV